MILEIPPDRGVAPQTEQFAEDLHRQRLGIGELRFKAPVPQPGSPDNPVKTIAHPQIHSNQLGVGAHLEPSPSGFPERDLSLSEAPSGRGKSRETGKVWIWKAYDRS